jgi:hypothetical protein
MSVVIDIQRRLREPGSLSFQFWSPQRIDMKSSPEHLKNKLDWLTAIIKWFGMFEEQNLVRSTFLETINRERPMFVGRNR